MKLSNVWVGDFETVTTQTNFFKQENRTKVLLFCLKKLKGEITYLGVNLEEWLNILLSWKTNQVIYYHNLNFDGEFIISWLDSKGWKVINKNEEPKAFTFSFLRQNNNIYMINLYLKSTSITIFCSLKQLSASIEALGKDLKISKYEEEINKSFYDIEPQDSVEKYPKNFVEYCIRDTEILKQAFFNFCKNLYNIQTSNWFVSKIDLNRNFTIGSIAYRLQMDFIKKFGLDLNYNYASEIKISPESYEIASKFYFGGITQFNPKIQYQTVDCPNGIGLDVNSQHPFSMTKLLPYGEMINFKKQKPPKNCKYLVYLELEIDSAISKTGDVLNLWNWNRTKGARYVQHMEFFKCYYLLEEWEMLQNFYTFTGVKVINKWWAKADYFLKEYVETLYKLKADYSAKGEKANAQTYKILLNSSYGKHATRADFSELLAVSEQEYYEMINQELVINGRLWKVSEPSELVTLKNSKLVKLEPLETKDKLFNKLIAATITAWSRIYLYETIYKLGVENFLYCDTDSIYLKDYKNLDCIKIHDTELGAWGIIEKFKKFTVKGAKAYVYQSEKGFKYTHSGINKNWLAKNFDIGFFETEEILLKESNLKKKKVEGGVVLEWVDYLSKKRTT